MSAAGNPIAHMTSSRAVTLFSDIPLILIPSAFVPLFKLSWIPGLLFHLLLLISPAATLFRFDERTIYFLYCSSNHTTQYFDMIYFWIFSRRDFVSGLRRPSPGDQQHADPPEACAQRRPTSFLAMLRDI